MLLCASPLATTDVEYTSICSRVCGLKELVLRVNLTMSRGISRTHLPPCREHISLTEIHSRRLLGTHITMAGLVKTTPYEIVEVGEVCGVVFM